MNWGKSVLRILDKTLCGVCAAIVLAFAVLLIVQVVLRQMGQPLFWIEELCQYLMIYLCFLGSAIAWGRREHLTVDFLPEMLAPVWRKHLKTLVDAIVLGFALWACWVSWDFAIFSMRKTSISMNAPVGYGYLGAPIGFAIMALQSLIFIGARNKDVAPAQPELEEVGM